MLVFMKAQSTPEELERVVVVAEGLGLDAALLEDAGRRIVRLTGDSDPPPAAVFEAMAGVEWVGPLGKPLRHVRREAGRPGTVIRVGGHAIGGGGFTLVAGPCAIENDAQLHEVARAVRAAGAHLLRGGAYKPRTSPYEFRGLGARGLALAERVAREHGLGLVTEAVDADSLELVERHADVVQIGARNMQNFALLERAGASPLPILLKRGFAATVEEWLCAAEYVIAAGNPRVILCERGIRTFSTHSRFTLDLSVVPVLERVTHLPVLVDPSHASGHARSVPPLARAALAAGADGVMIEVHPDPRHALCDGPQSLDPGEFAALAASLRALAPLIDRQREAVP